jgi:hypothetical protein
VTRQLYKGGQQTIGAKALTSIAWKILSRAKTLVRYAAYSHVKKSYSWAFLRTILLLSSTQSSNRKLRIVSERVSWAMHGTVRSQNSAYKH